MTYGRAFALGVEEELLLVDPDTHLLMHDAERVLAGVEGLQPDLYLALVESASPISADAAEAVATLAQRRAAVRALGPELIGAGIHPAGPFGEAPHVPTERYREVAAQLRGLSQRTPTCALHVHVGMPDEDTALRVYNGLREHLPLITALAANSPFWHGIDSGLQSARTQMFRAYPRADIPPAYPTWDDYDASIEAIVRAGDIPDYTFMWWDLRPHPNLGTVEVRAMDAQSSLADVTGLAALIHHLARGAADETGRARWSLREALMESSFRAARDGVAATLWHDGALRPVAEIFRAVTAGAEDPALEEVERMLADGNGADRQRAAFARGGMQELLATLVAEAAAPPPAY